MTKESTEVRPREQLLGDIAVRITGMQYYYEVNRPLPLRQSREHPV